MITQKSYLYKIRIEILLQITMFWNHKWININAIKGITKCVQEKKNYIKIVGYSLYYIIIANR